MRNQLAISVLIAALVPACASEHPDVEVAPAPLAPLPACDDRTRPLERILITRPVGIALDDPEPARPDLGALIDDTRPACQCTTPECLIDWIEVNVGCDVCAHVQCGSGTSGACVPCATTVLVAADEVAGPCLLPAEPTLARE